jgi:hypothetical protein
VNIVVNVWVVNMAWPKGAPLDQDTKFKISMAHCNKAKIKRDNQRKKENIKNDPRN